MRQDHDAAHHRRARAAGCRRQGPVRRHGHDFGPDRTAQCRDGVPVLRPVPQHVGGGQYRLRAEDPRCCEGERAARVAELVALMNITGLENRRIDQLSGGQRQRVALARAVAIRPGILLLDEPLTALDAALRDRLRSELNRLLRALGITTIYVTHDQAEAMELGDRIVVMRKGAIAQIGTPREVYFAPKDGLWRSSSERRTLSRLRSRTAC
ncbi:ABC transporter ATP-binding protein [Bradyrhizobium elkanii]|uniref:ABC transporter ATP-binding protein n=1 Tax=Bradyrhizobium elkanii TaxID=29448 RepID=UPI003F738948